MPVTSFFIVAILMIATALQVPLKKMERKQVQMDTLQKQQETLQVQTDILQKQQETLLV